jgi:hypothetical protein
MSNSDPDSGSDSASEVSVTSSTWERLGVMNAGDDAETEGEAMEEADEEEAGELEEIEETEESEALEWAVVGWVGVYKAALDCCPANLPLDATAPVH